MINYSDFTSLNADITRSVNTLYYASNQFKRSRVSVCYHDAISGTYRRSVVEVSRVFFRIAVYPTGFS